MSCGDSHSGIVSNEGHLYMMGWSDYGWLGLGEEVDGINIQVPSLVESLSNRKVKIISCGANHSLALDNEGWVFSWGCGTSGALGIGTFEN